jgi:peroxiredoxin 2/4
MAVIVGRKAPIFRAPAVVNGGEIVENFSLEDYVGKKYVVFFFYPADFTFVCPTEILAFQARLAEFEKRNAAVVGCSVDSQFSHWKWLNTERRDGGIKGVTFPLVVDQSKTIAQAYDVLAGHYDKTDDGEMVFVGIPMAYRGLFLIDMNGTVQHQVINNFPLGRSVDEILRMVDALQFTEKHGEVCPVDWRKGDDALKPTQAGVAAYLSKH